jgi:hypothetical protein
LLEAKQIELLLLTGAQEKEEKKRKESNQAEAHNSNNGLIHGTTKEQKKNWKIAWIT